MMKRKNSSCDSVGQEKITKYFLRSRVPPKFKDNEATSKVTGARKRNALPTRDFENSENPSGSQENTAKPPLLSRIPPKFRGKENKLKVEALKGTVTLSKNPENPCSNSCKQENITKRSRIPMKLKDSEVQGSGIGKRNAASARRLRSSENRSLASEVKVPTKKVRPLGSLRNRVDLVRMCHDPYDFDAFMTEYEKENTFPKSEGGAKRKTRPKKETSSGFVKPKTVKAKKVAASRTRNTTLSKKVPVAREGVCVDAKFKIPSGVSFEFAVKVSSAARYGNSKPTTNAEASEMLLDATGIEVARRESHFEKSSALAESPESILGGLVDVCKGQHMAIKCSKLSASLYHDSDSMSTIAGTTPSTKDKLTDPERCTSTPQAIDAAAVESLVLSPFSIGNVRDDAVSFGNPGVSPIHKASRPYLREVDLNTSGFLAEKNIRTYRRHGPNPKKCWPVESEPDPIARKKKITKKNKKCRLPKNFEKLVTSANETLVEAEQFELVIE